MMVDLAQWFVGVAPAKNEVLAGIQQCQILIERGAVQVHCSCRETIREMGAHSWDPSADGRGDPERPLKRDDHAPDAFRYYIHSEAKQTPITVYGM